MGMRRSLLGRAALLAAVVAAAGQSGLAQADTRVTRDSSAGSYVRYDGATDATMLACSTGPQDAERAERRRSSGQAGRGRWRLE